MDINVPVYYILSRKLEKEQAGPILQALNITPVIAAVIHDVCDTDLALMFTTQLFRCKTESASCEIALTIAEEHSFPVLVVGTADLLDAVYRDGQRKAVIGTA